MNISLTKVVAPVPVDLQPRPNRQAQGAAAPVEAVENPAADAPEPVNQKQMEAIASQLQEFLSSSDRDIEFRVDADTKAQVVTVRDARSGEVIRQFPNADALRVLKNLAAQQGTFFNGKA